LMLIVVLAGGVDLTDEQRSVLQALTNSPDVAATVATRARVVLCRQRHRLDNHPPTDAHQRATHRALSGSGEPAPAKPEAHLTHDSRPLHAHPHRGPRHLAEDGRSQRKAPVRGAGNGYAATSVTFHDDHTAEFWHRPSGQPSRCLVGQQILSLVRERWRGGGSARNVGRLTGQLVPAEPLVADRDNKKCGQ
jgi:hypothetical protein